MKMHVTVPPNTTAEVSVPSDDAAGVLVDSQSLDEAIEGVRIIDPGKRHSVGSHMASLHDGPAAACGVDPCRSGRCSPAAAGFGAGSSQKCDGV